MKTLKSIFFPIMLTISLVIFLPSLGFTTEQSQREREETYKNLEIFSNVLSILQEYYVEEIDTSDIIEGAINGLLHSLDPHSSYLTANDFQELQDETQGSFTGIGIEITIRKGKLTVVSPIEGTPAYNAEIQANDVIEKIGEHWTKDMSPVEAVKLLRGPKGTKVTISIAREGWDSLKEIELTRDIIPVQSVRSLFIHDGIAYIRITNFQNHTTDDFTQALKALKEKQSIKGLILDLRNNPGGLLNQAVSISDLFIDEGLIVYTKGRTKEQNMVFNARNAGTLPQIPLVVLVNEGSASASEIVAGAIQDHKKGLIAGTKTFGKGSVQTIVPLQDGAGLRMTTARYFTPSGRSIQATGITPDVEIPYVPANSEPKAKIKTDPQREEDLVNHFENNSNSEHNDTSVDTIATIAEQQSAIGMTIAERLKRDNQLKIALDIVKGVTLLSQDISPIR